MLYSIIATMQNGNTATTHVDAKSNRDAHQAAKRIYPVESVRVYPTTQDGRGNPIIAGLVRGALMVARRTAINAVLRTGGTETQLRIESELNRLAISVADCEDAAHIMAVLSEYSDDSQDFFSAAMQGLLDGIAAGKPIDEQYHAAYLTLNKYVQSLRGLKDTSIEYLVDGGGDIVAITTAYHQIIEGGDKWIPTAAGEMDAETTKKLGKVLSAAMANLTKTQRDIVYRLAMHQSQREIAEKTGRTLETVEKNIAISRGKITAYIHFHAPELEYMVDIAKTNESTEKWEKRAKSTESRRTDAGKAKHAEQMKATQAERARRYRARKAAEKAAANQN